MSKSFLVLFFKKELLPFFLPSRYADAMRTLLSVPDISRFAALRDAGFILVDDLPATLLVNFAADAEGAIARAEKFADAMLLGQEGLVVNILPPHGKDDWRGARAAALVWAHTRHAALAWAPRRIRVNAIGLGVSPVLADQPVEDSGRAAGVAPSAVATTADIVGTVVAVWRFASMTGQLIRLGAPLGAA